MIKVSVILPTYNGSRFIARAIESVLSQSYNDYEFLIINDGSTDNTGEIVQEFAALDKRIRYFNNETNLGFDATLNRGLYLATGKYIARIDDDDYWIDKDKLKMQVEFMDSHPDHVLVGTGCVIMDENDRKLSRYMPPGTDTQIRNIILRSIVFYHSTVMFPRLLIIDLGGYDPAYYCASDYDLFLKLGTRGRLANLPVQSVAYTMRLGNMSSQRIIQQLRDLLIIITKYKKFYNHYYYSILRTCGQYLIYAGLGYLRYHRCKALIAGIIEKTWYLLRRSIDY